ncbi:MAG: retropepsin-like aspartic protease [Erythrobacter sp.]|uniref:retropepsin-like aspartic protease n=1 Tax=Erythrobacter sp. TaxID=1042 RepID=UPI00261573BF|nr:retropepsin-like aspartic protease [Erythrobacter sp.]MDJ0978597.1 retropepsin-like aspartic protease [Erythrobacter sp.]
MSTARGAPTFRARSGDEDVCALFDTGSDKTFVDIALADRLGLKIGELSKEARSLTGTLPVSRVFAVPVEVPGQFRFQGSLHAVALPKLDCADGTRLSLILGQEFVNAMVILTDNTSKRIAFHASGYVKPDADKYVRIPWSGNTVSGQVAGRKAILKVDTGSATDLAFQAKHFDTFFADRDRTTLAVSTNASGRQDESVGIAAVEYQIEAVAKVGDVKRVADREAPYVGNLGYPFFAEAMTIFDAGKGAIWLQNQGESH